MSASENRKQRQSKLRGEQTGDDDYDGGEEDDKEQQGEEQEEDGGSRCNGVCGEKEKEVGRMGVFGISRDFRSAIKRTFGRRRKVKEKATADGENRRSPSSRGCGGGFYGCFMPPMTEECPETPTSDPNSERFSFEMLRALIESSDFYCEESNPHI